MNGFHGMMKVSRNNKCRHNELNCFHNGIVNQNRLYLLSSKLFHHNHHSLYGLSLHKKNIDNNTRSKNIVQISKRFKIPNPRLSLRHKEVQRLDFRKEQTEKIESGHLHSNYENLDWTNQDFLDDLDEQHIANTYPNWQNRMKNFIQFTDDEFDNFTFNNNNNNTNINDNTINAGYNMNNMDFNDGDNDREHFNPNRINGFSENVYEGPSQVSDSLEYLHQWKQKLDSEKHSFKDDFEVTLPSGVVMSFREYIETSKNKNNLNNNNNNNQLRNDDSESGTNDENENEMNDDIDDFDSEMRDRNKHNLNNDNNGNNMQLKEAKLDEFGRAWGKGHKKKARGQAFVYPGNGNIYVNGTHYSEYFKNYAERLNVSLPLLITDTHRELDCYCIVHDGGPSSRSTALREAISKAIVNYSPQLKDMLEPYKLLDSDIRRRERKKPGLRAARKAERWKRR